MFINAIDDCLSLMSLAGSAYLFCLVARAKRHKPPPSPDVATRHVGTLETITCYRHAHSTSWENDRRPVESLVRIFNRETAEREH